VRVTAKADHQLLSEASISAYKEDFQTTAPPVNWSWLLRVCATDLLVLVFNGRGEQPNCTLVAQHGLGLKSPIFTFTAARTSVAGAAVMPEI